MTHPPVDAIRIRPVRFDRHDIETFARDEGLRHLCADLVELMSAVRRLADQHETRIADGFEQRITSIRCRLEPHCGVADRVQRGTAHDRCPPVRATASIASAGTRYARTTSSLRTRQHDNIAPAGVPFAATSAPSSRLFAKVSFESWNIDPRIPAQLPSPTN